MKPVMLKEDVYWVGAIDWNLRSFHGYVTPRGTTYNAYLVMDEKITLIDTVKANFSCELLSRLGEVVDPARIDYIVVNHVEMDHSGSLLTMLAAAPHAMVVTNPAGEKALRAHYGDGFPIQVIKSGDTLCLGKRTLQFVQTAMVHWPDNMVSYCPEEHILFSNDAFGQHDASHGRFDDELPRDEVLEEAATYYANIVLPFGAMVQKALQALQGLPIDLIAPSHGLIWRSHIPEILRLYTAWCANEVKEEAVVVYDTMWGSTDKMARAVLDGLVRRGVSVRLCNLQHSHISDVMAHLLTAKYICVGSATLNNGMLPTVAAFLAYMKGLSPKNRVGLAFGSYGWSGQAAGQISEALTACGFTQPLEFQRLTYIPSAEQLDALTKAVEEQVR